MSCRWPRVTLVFLATMVAGSTVLPGQVQAPEPASSSTAPATAEALALQASALYDANDHAGARKSASDGLGRAEQEQDQAIIGRLNLLLSILDDQAGARDDAARRAQRSDQAFRAAGDMAGGIRARLQFIRVSTLPADEARLLLEGAAEDARAIGDARLEVHALHALGDRLFNSGQLDVAYDTLNRALPLARALGDGIVVGTIYNSLGRVYRAHGRLEDALAMQKAALALHETTSDTLAHVQSLNAVGAVYQRLGDLPNARAYTERAAALAERSGSTRAHDFLQANLAGLLLDGGDAARAAKVLEQVIGNGRDVFVATRYLQLSEAYTRLGRHDLALRAAEQALTACGESQEACISARAARGRARLANGDPQAALDDINQAHAMLERMRAALVPSDFFRMNFPLVHERLYGSAIALQVQQARASDALETAERSRARAFLDLLASRSIAVPDATVAEPLIAPAESRRGDTAQAAPATTAALVASARRLGSTLLAYWVAHDEVFIWVVSGDGKVVNARVPVLRTKLARLVRDTSPWMHTAPAGGNEPAATVVTRGMRRVPARRTRDIAWRELHALLVAPVRAALPTAPDALLTIVPHGPLVGLSFAALQDGRGRYLLEDYTVHYVPAGALLDFTRTRRRENARTEPMLLVADPSLPRRAALDIPLAPLPGARREVAAIARLAPSGQAAALIGADATEAAVRTRVSGPSVLHFATHAVVRDDDPFASYLALGASTVDPVTDGDGLLSADEVYRLTLDADLVVLSACQSAGGMTGGDGVSTFARAFLYAGTASLLASVWDVADEPTNRLLPVFYQAWRGGQTKAQALRVAQLRLLRDLRAGRVRVSTPIGPVPVSEHPVFWAGFALFGEPD